MPRHRPFSLAARRPRPGLLVIAGAAVAVAALAAGCASPSHTYVGSSRYNMVFRVPTDWHSYSAHDLGQVLGASLDPSFGNTFPFMAGFDAAPDPSITDVTTPARLLDHPVVLGWIHKLGFGAHDQISLRTLRNVYYPVDQIEDNGSGSTVDYSSFTMPGGYWGNRLTFILRGNTPTTADKQLEFSQIAATDQKAQYEYVLIVSCSPDCFARNKAAIDDILSSWKLKA
jgi:hypothetical protein